MESMRSPNDEEGLPPLIEPKEVGYREPAPRPIPTEKFYLVYNLYMNQRLGGKVDVRTTVEQFDFQHEVEARLVEMHVQSMVINDVMVFHGTLSRPQVQVEKTFRVEYK